MLIMRDLGLTEAGYMGSNGLLGRIFRLQVSHQYLLQERVYRRLLYQRDTSRNSERNTYGYPTKKER